MATLALNELVNFLLVFFIVTGKFNPNIFNLTSGPNFG